ALSLRAAALRALAGCEADWPRLEQCSAATWQVFFRTERCALALKTRLTAAGCAVPDRVRAEIERAATRELQRILSARGQLQRIASNAVHIEVHFALNDVELTDAMWHRARPLDGAVGLSRLGAVDHLWHLLVHSVVTHPHRRGALRDVLLPAEALGGCSPAEVKEVERLIAGHPLFQPLGDVLAMARELRSGLPVQDRFRREAAANYVLRGPLGWLGFSRFWTSAFLSALFALLEGGDDRRREWTLAWSRSSFPCVWGWAAWLEARAPRLGRWCRSAMRVMRLI